MKTKFYLKSSVLGAALAAAVAVAGSPAYAVEAKISGQVNRALMLVDDEHSAETYHVDNDNSSTRFRFTGSGDMGSGIKAGLVWEVEYQSNSANQVSNVGNNFNDPAGSPDIDERKMEVYFQGGFGKVSIGQGDGAMNGGIERDLSGTSVVAYAGNTDIGRRFQFREDDAANAFSDIDIGDVLSQQDFLSRYDRLRYDSPKLGPIVISASTGHTGDDDAVEYGLRVNTKLGGGGKLTAAYGIARLKDSASPEETETTGGSISVLLAGGLNFTLAASNVEQDVGTRDSDFTYFKVGYKMGQHAFSFDFGKGEDQSAEAGATESQTGREGETTGVQYVYMPVKWAELYAGYKIVELDDNAAVSGNSGYDDLTFLLAGSRIKF